MKEFKLEDEIIRSGFKAPDQYFDSLHEQVLNKLHSPERPTVSILKNRNIQWLVAAVLIIAIGVLATFNLSKSDFSPNSEEIENYLAVHSSITDEELFSALDESDIVQLQSELALDESVLEEVLSNNPDIEQYILTP